MEDDVSEQFSVEKEFEKAQQWKLTDEDIERARLLVGLDAPETRDLYLTEASANNIRNYANGVGDDNPLYCDPDYGARTRWGSQIAPPSMAEIITKTLYGDRIPKDVAQATKGIFRGVHVFISGSEKFFYRPIYPGDSLYAFSGEEDLEVKPSEFSERTVTRFKRRVKMNQKAEVVYNQRIRSIYAERGKAVKRGKNMKIEPTQYTDEALARIDEIYAQEHRRGPEPRYFEDVEVGEAMPAMVKGPLLVTHMIAYHAGGYGIREYGLFGSRLWHANRERIPPFYVKNEQGIPDVAQRLHWDNHWAQAIGNPMAYDYGVVRESWFNHYLTDWVGDDGWVFRQYDEMRKFNYIGDTQFLKGQVAAMRVVDDRFEVDLVLEMTNQRDEKTTVGEATVLLPSREHGPVLLPDVPADLARRATRMYMRHNVVKDEMRRRS
jgi:acyl dehydratase